MSTEGIDASALFTMLGLIAAVWAVVPSSARLSFRLSLNWFDWLVIWAVYIDGQDHVLLAELRRLRTELSAAIDAAS